MDKKLAKFGRERRVPRFHEDKVLFLQGWMPEVL